MSFADYIARFNTAASEKIIFLDFDGPLSSFRVMSQTDSNLDFDPVAVGMLRNVCEVTGARIVCTSVRTWAHSIDDFKEMQKLFDEAGLDLALLHPDWTVNKKRVDDRKQNILDYLAAHPEIKQYAIIDDDYVDLPELVLVDAMNGILFKNLEQLCALLSVDIGKVFRRDYYRKKPRNQYFLPFSEQEDRFNERIDNPEEESKPKP